MDDKTIKHEFKKADDFSWAIFLILISVIIIAGVFFIIFNERLDKIECALGLTPLDPKLCSVDASVVPVPSCEKCLQLDVGFTPMVECVEWDTRFEPNPDWYDSCCFDYESGTNMYELIKIDNETYSLKFTIDFNVANPGRYRGWGCLDSANGDYMIETKGKNISTEYCNSIHKTITKRGECKTFKRVS